jgi:glycosyltransferase involved in cell wall biosynthesis
MKISIVIPSNNEANYVEELLDYIKIHSNPNNIEEVIIVESFQTKRIVKVAEKSHAKLYYNQAKAEVIYFINPGCIPPIGFDDRILKYVKEKYEMGCFDFEHLASDNYFESIYKTIMAFFLRDIKSPKSFYVLSNLFYQSGGFKTNANYLKLKNQVLSLGKLVHN